MVFTPGDLTLDRCAPVNPGMIFIERDQLGTVTIDRDAGIIRNVKVIGTRSRNGRQYPMPVLEKAIPLYEGAPVKVDHPLEGQHGRSVKETFGSLRNVRAQHGANPGLVADLHFLKANAIAPQVCETAERFPEHIGLSHNADGTGRRTSDGFLVERIDKVFSVDLVDNPATNTSLFEGYDPMQLRQLKVKDIVGGLPASKAKAEMQRLIEEGGLSGDSSAAVADMPSPEAAIDAVFKAEVAKAMDDPDLDYKARMARIKEILTAQEKTMKALMSATGGGDKGGDNPSPAPAENPTDQEPTAEGQKTMLGQLMEEVKRLRADLSAKDAAEKLREQLEGRDVTPDQFKALLAVPEANRSVLIEAIAKKPAGGGGSFGTFKPRTTGSTNATGGGGNPGDMPKGKALLEAMAIPARGNLN